MELIIRRMERKDIPFFNHTRNLVREYLHDPTEYTLEESFRWFDENNPKYFIIGEWYKPYGYIRTSNWTEESVTIGMDLHPNYQGRGLAIQFYDQLFRILKDFMDFKRVNLWVRKDNTRALSLYENLGFYLVEEKDYNGMPSYYMEKDL